MKIPKSPKSLHELLKETDQDTLMSIFQSPPEKRTDYIHWDKLRHKPPPNDLTHKTWWLKIKLSRQQQYKFVPMTDKEGNQFKFILTNKIQQFCHLIDSKSRGSMLLDTNNRTLDKEQYIFMSLVEEAFTSSVLEGAVSTRHEAISMIHQGKRPKNKSEKMILNNYLAMKSLQKSSCEPLSLDLIKKLHIRITEDTLDPKDLEGKFQTPDEQRVAIWDDRDNTCLHIPPKAGEIENRLEQMIQFSSSNSEDEFIHPVIKAIIIHFWLAYVHPFADGNGRLARSLFYKSMLCDGYWLFAYISISNVIKNAPSKYARAFLYTETDDNDLTYFIHHQLDCILKAIENVETYIQKKVSKIKELERRLKTSKFNNRQLALLSHALKHPNEEYSVKSHQTIHRVSYATARSDLLFLQEKGLLIDTKRGNQLIWLIPNNFNKLLDNLT